MRTKFVKVTLGVGLDKEFTLTGGAHTADADSTRDGINRREKMPFGEIGVRRGLPRISTEEEFELLAESPTRPLAPGGFG